MKITREAIAEVDPEILLADGLDDAFIGLSVGHHHKPVACYSYERAVEIIARRDGMGYEAAEEYLQFNTLGAYVGEYTPIWVQMPLEVDE